MPWIVKAACAQCGHDTGELLDRGLSIFECRKCRRIRSITRSYRRFELPNCGECGQQFSRSDRVDYDDGKTSRCPACDRIAMLWNGIAIVKVKSETEPKPTMGEHVHGWIINTGRLQRLEIVRSYYRGRISPDAPLLPDGTPVEAEVISGGERSFDVRIIATAHELAPSKPHHSDRS